MLISSLHAFINFLWEVYLSSGRVVSSHFGFLLFIIVNVGHAVWAITMAAYKTEMEAPELAMRTVLFAIGGTVVHSAACVINDICDIDFDRQVGESNRNIAFFA